jgi:hypothetical protein
MIDIKGFDLKTDGAIQETCRVANESTGLTRSVLYAIVFTSVLSVIALWNSRENSWLSLRINLIAEQKNALIDSLLDSTRIMALTECQFASDTCCQKAATIARLERTFKKMHSRIDDKKVQLDKLLKVEAESSTRFHIPVFGTSTDVNDLGITSGLALSILMFILLFTLGREYNNLKIAFLSITERYTDHCDKRLFREEYAEAAGKISNNETIDGAENSDYEDRYMNFLKDLNFTRRKHHYNYLSMNEIFTLPTLSNNFKPSGIKKLSTYVIWLSPIVAQSAIFCYDLSTRKNGMTLDGDATLAALIYDAVFLVFIAVTCYACIRRKFEFSLLWDDFYSHHYKLKGKLES